MLRVVTFLGMGELQDPDRLFYKPCRYTLDGKVSPETRQHDVATLLVHGGPASVVVVGTEDVGHRWFGKEQLYETRLRAQVPPETAMEIGFARVPRGTTAEERWAIFGTIVRLLDPGPLTGEVVEREPPSAIVLDITHGFRSQPFFAASAVAFVRSQQRRRRGATGPSIRILYAAYDARDEGIAPVWDMTQFVDALEWDAAIDGLMRYGRADDLAQLVQRDQKEANSAVQAEGGASFPRLKGLGATAKQFADGLTTARIPALLTKHAGALAREIEQSRSAVVQRIPPLAAQLDELDSWARSVQATAVVSGEGLQSSLALARLYLRLERYAEAAITLRETAVTAWSLRRPRADVLQPAAGTAFDRQREEDDHAIRDASTAADPEPLAAVFRNVANLRNDVQHGAYRSSPRQAEGVRKQLEQQMEELARILGEAQTATAAVPALDSPVGPFMNFSNHGVATWSPAQVQAALDLGLGEPTDVPDGMPQVAPDAGEDHVWQLATDLADRAAALGAAGAVVMGEYSLSFALVEALRRQGVRCFAATTERQTQVTYAADGSARKESVFRFVRWREYRPE